LSSSPSPDLDEVGVSGVEEGTVASPAASSSARRKTRGDRARLALAFVAGALAVVFAVLNLDEVAVHWIVGVWRTPLIVVIVVCVILGAIIGWVTGRRRAA
jgi:uncharacterized integral membrane protein